jgi:hypothetical protein
VRGEMSDHLRDQYQAALARVAEKAGITPEVLEESLQKNYESLQYTSACLTLEETEKLCRGEFLGPERHEHIQDCEFCRALLDAISAPLPPIPSWLSGE